MKLVFLGPPGAGKGTQAAVISQALNIPHISTGDMFRKAIREATPTGLKAKAFIDQGQLVPDSVTVEMVKERLSEDDCKGGYLLDGFPRTLVQAQTFAKIADKIGKPVEAVIALEVDFEILKERITGRRICPKCGAIFHMKNHPPKVEGICDECGAELSQRKDDTVEQLKVRMDEYEKSTKPVIDFYEGKGVVTHIDAANKPAEVFEKIKEALGKID